MKTSSLKLGAFLMLCFALGGGVAWLTKRERRMDPVAVPPTPAPEPVPAPPPPPARQARTGEGKHVLAMEGLLSELRKRAEARRVAGREATAQEKAEEELIDAQAGDAVEALGMEIKRNPASWGEVVDLVTTSPDLKGALRMADLLAEALDDGGEAIWAARLLKGGAARARLIAATALARGKSPASLPALVEAAERDSDAATRLASLQALARRRANGASPAEATMIDATLRLRADSDPDESIRATARNLVDPRQPEVQRPSGRDTRNFGRDKK